MLSELWKTLLEYLKRTPYWDRIEPVALAGFLYVGVSVVVFQYLQWQYQVSLALPLFLQSYLFKQVSVAFWTLVLVYTVSTYGVGRHSPNAAASMPQPGRQRARLAVKAIVVVLLVAVALFAWGRLAPHRKVSSIRVIFVPRGEFGLGPVSSPPALSAAASQDFRKLKDALVYILFELNRLQRTWHFELDFTNFRRDFVPAEAQQACEQAETPGLCFAETLYRLEHSKDASFPPLVLITSDPLDPAAQRYRFWLHRGAVSVLTIREWQGISTPSIYEYVAYTLLLQGLLIHLDASCGGLPPRPSEREGIIYGNVFEYYPRSEGMKAALLSGHLGPEDERLLLNCFGPEYMRQATQLLRLDWLRSGPVRANLRTVYGIDLQGEAFDTGKP